MSPSPPSRCVTIRIGGMTCASCELLLERKFKAIPGVTHAVVSHKQGTARITADGGDLPSKDRIRAVVRMAGYTLADEHASAAAGAGSDGRKWAEIGGSLLVILAVYKLLQTFDLVSLAPSTSGACRWAASSSSASSPGRAAVWP